VGFALPVDPNELAAAVATTYTQSRLNLWRNYPDGKNSLDES
jgi:hypothetical protein